MNGPPFSTPTRHRIAVALLVLPVLVLLAACGGSGGSDSGDNGSGLPTVQALSMTLPREDAFPVGASADIAVEASMSNGTTRPLEPSQFDWTSSNPLLASVNGDGVVTGRAPGKVTIRGSASGLPTGQIDMEVVGGQPDPSDLIRVRIQSRARTNDQIVGPAGASTRDLALTGIYGVTDGELRMRIPPAEVSWDIENEGVASISPTDPATLNFLSSSDTTTITGTEGISGNNHDDMLQLVVTGGVLLGLNVEGAPDPMLTGTSANLSAVAEFDKSELDVTFDSTWRSNDTDVVSLGTTADNKQPITAEAGGNATVTARYSLNNGEMKEAKANIAVRNATLGVDRANDADNTDSSYEDLCTPGTASYSPSDCTWDETIDVSVTTPPDKIFIDRLRFTADGTSWTFQRPILEVSGTGGAIVPIDTNDGDLLQGDSIPDGESDDFAMAINKADIPDGEDQFTITVRLYFTVAATGQTLRALDGSYTVNVTQ